MRSPRRRFDGTKGICVARGTGGSRSMCGLRARALQFRRFSRHQTSQLDFRVIVWSTLIMLVMGLRRKVVLIHIVPRPGPSRPRCDASPLTGVQDDCDIGRGEMAICQASGWPLWTYIGGALLSHSGALRPYLCRVDGLLVPMKAGDQKVMDWLWTGASASGPTYRPNMH